MAKEDQLKGAMAKLPGGQTLVSVSRLALQGFRDLRLLGARLVGAQNLELKALTFHNFRDLYSIDPNGIDRSLNHREDKTNRFVASGEWDVVSSAPLPDAKPILYETVHMMFVDGAHYRETPQYRQMRDAVTRYRAGEIARPDRHGAYWCRDLPDIDRYFEILQRVYEQIRDEGYRTQEQLARENGELVKKSYDEISICLSRDGTPILEYDGTHRLLMCQILNVPSAPVQVKRVHADWAKEAMDRFKSIRSAEARLKKALAETFPLFQESE